MQPISHLLTALHCKLYSAWTRDLAKAVAIASVVVISLFTAVLPAHATTYNVKMGSDTGQLKFVPEILNIKKGDTVRWVMNKVPPHNVVFEERKIPGADGSLAKSLSHKQLLFGPGDSYESTFSEDVEAGIYPYYCEPHRGAGMAGQIVVEEP